MKRILRNNADSYHPSASANFYSFSLSAKSSLDSGDFESVNFQCICELFRFKIKFYVILVFISSIHFYFNPSNLLSSPNKETRDNDTGSPACAGCSLRVSSIPRDILCSDRQRVRGETIIDPGEYNGVMIM